MSDQSRETTYISRPRKIQNTEEASRANSASISVQPPSIGVSDHNKDLLHQCFDIVEQIRKAHAEETASQSVESICKWVTKVIEPLGPLSGPARLQMALVLGADSKRLTTALESVSSYVATARPAECPTLRATLKVLVNRSIEANLSAMEAAGINVDGRLTYDVGIIERMMEFKSQTKENSRVTIVLEDADSFQPELLGSLIIHLSAYAETIPFYLILCVRTPVSLFETRLPARVAHHVHSQVFVSGDSITEQDSSKGFVGKCVVALADAGLALDPGFAALLYKESSLPRQADQLKYALLHHFVVCKEDARRLAVGNVELQTSVFDPTYRASIERSLSLAPNSTPISLVFRIVHDSGAYVNLFEAYTAFKMLLLGDDLTDDQNKQALAWFLSLMAELKLMGIVRDCKRKFECVEKVAYMNII